MLKVNTDDGIGCSVINSHTSSNLLDILDVAYKENSVT